MRTATTWYLLAYSSSNPALDGTYRKIDVRVRRPDMKIRARGGYVASPSVEQVTRRGYEEDAVAALTRSPSPSAFPFQLRAISTPIDGKPGLTSLVAVVDTRVMTFRENATARTYDGEVTVLARVTSKDGDALVTQSQLYQMHGDLGKLDAARHGRLLFFRTPEVPPGSHTVEWVVRDGKSGDASVLRSAMDVPLPEVPMLVDSGDPAPSTRIELLHAGQSLGTIDVPTAKADNDSLRQVGTLPIDKLPPGVYELKATVTVGDRRVARTAMFTVVP